MAEETGAAPAAEKTDAADRGRRKEVVGLVTSDKMEKTIAVTVIRLEKHPKYKKFVRRRSRFYVHDEKREARVGDRVLIQETRPLSKLKRWRLVKIVEKSRDRSAPRAGETPS